MLKKSRTRGKKVLAWQFNFRSQGQEFLAQETYGGKTVFLFLVCGDKVCALKWNNAVRLMDYDANGQQQPLRVTYKNGHYLVRGCARIS
ncbi:MAG: hypothetical protein C4293_17295 [Nitrospiraceae bacterium]